MLLSLDVGNPAGHNAINRFSGFLSFLMVIGKIAASKNCILPFMLRSEAAGILTLCYICTSPIAHCTTPHFLSVLPYPLQPGLVKNHQGFVQNPRSPIRVSQCITGFSKLPASTDNPNIRHQKAPSCPNPHAPTAQKSVVWTIWPITHTQSSLPNQNAISYC